MGPSSIAASSPGGRPTPPRVLFVSRYAEVSASEHDPDVLAVPLLVKPFSLRELFTAVNRALETPEPCRRLIDTATRQS
jgi:CheY-like chemotaxis protein